MTHPRDARIDVGALEAKGWRDYHDASPVNPALNFEAYLWACHLWGYQQTGDPASDQLYTTGFALLGFHEAHAATGDDAYRDAGDRLAQYLARIQVKSDALPYLDGAWFRAFDYGRWDYWSSSADVGWGAWSVEAGWGPAWITAVMGLRIKETSAWEMTQGSTIEAKLETVKRDLAKNAGGPRKRI